MDEDSVPGDDVGEGDAGGGKPDQQAKCEKAQKCQYLGCRRRPVFFTITYEEDTSLLAVSSPMPPHPEAVGVVMPRHPMRRRVRPDRLCVNHTSGKRHRDNREHKKNRQPFHQKSPPKNQFNLSRCANDSRCKMRFIVKGPTRIPAGLVFAGYGEAGQGAEKISLFAKTFQMGGGLVGEAFGLGAGALQAED